MTPYENLINDFQNQKILILGLGLQGGGLGDAIFFAKRGFEVKITDLKTPEQLETSLQKLQPYKNISYTLGEHQLADVEWADIVVRNPAVPWTHPMLQKAKDLGKKIHMSSELLVNYSGEATIIGVTGTRGKTTTTQMIYELLQLLPNKTILLGGNLKDVATLPLIESIHEPENTIILLELSSWALQAFDLYHLSPDIAVFTSFYPDHLNTYPTIEEYLFDKQTIFRHQTPEDKLVIGPSLMHQTTNWIIPSQLIKTSLEQLPTDLHLHIV